MLLEVMEKFSKLLDVGEQKKFLKVTMFPEHSGECLQEEQQKMLENKW